MAKVRSVVEDWLAGVVWLALQSAACLTCVPLGYTACEQNPVGIWS